jgi:3-dehydroquinate synthase
VERLAGTARRVYVTDPNVRRAWGGRLVGGDVVEVGLGEDAKTLETVERVYDRWLELGVDRSTLIIGVGGGIVCDVAGFAASTYLRGLPFGFVASTLLAQVDASVGGKNGVNLHRYKNLVGVFRQPRFVVCDFELLRTLPARELGCGLAEVVKAAAIADAELFELLERTSRAELFADTALLEEVVARAVGVKARIVAEDELETGEERVKLNFGHTLGHAIEKTRPEIVHGEAVSLGMVAAARLSVASGLLPAAEAERLVRLLARLELPTALPMDSEAVVAAMAKDKKRFGDNIRFVLLERLGAAVVRPVPVRELTRVLA